MLQNETLTGFALLEQMLSVMDLIRAEYWREGGTVLEEWQSLANSDGRRTANFRNAGQLFFFVCT